MPSAVPLGGGPFPLVFGPLHTRAMLNPRAFLLSRGRPAKLPLRRLLDVLRGRVRWFPGSGWCDQGLVDITVHSVASPTVKQLQFVQRERPYLGNLLQVRRALQAGDCFGYCGPLPDVAEQTVARLRELGLPCSVAQSRVWRPLSFESSETKTAT